MKQQHTFKEHPYIKAQTNSFMVSKSASFATLNLNVDKYYHGTENTHKHRQALAILFQEKSSYSLG